MLQYLGLAPKENHSTPRPKGLPLPLHHLESEGRRPLLPTHAPASGICHWPNTSRARGQESLIEQSMEVYLSGHRQGWRRVGRDRRVQMEKIQHIHSKGVKTGS